MYVLSFHSLLPHSITTIIFFLVTSSPPVTGDQFLICNSTYYNCGEIKDIGYPFWGGDRPKECGHPDFELTCHENTNLTTMIINSLSFRVFDIDILYKYTMKIERSDLFDDQCPNRSISETRLSNGPFLYFPDLQNITLHFDCNSSFHLPPEYSRFGFKCNEDGVDKMGFMSDNSVASGVWDPYEESCESRVEVPISEIRLTEVRGNKTELLTALNQGISVVYNGSYEYCLACEKSNGICWSGTSLEEPTCLCRDGIYPYLCGFDDKGKSGKVGMKIGIGIGGAALCFVAFCTILYAYCRRQKGYSSGNELDLQGSLNHSGCIGGIFKQASKKRKEYGNLEVFMEQYGSLAPMVYSYSDIKKMTNLFKHKLGQGGYGKVYKGNLHNGLHIAVKVLNSTKGNGEEFINEVASISRTSHVNVVNLLGFCFHGTKRALVYEFMANGSLEKYIHENSTHLEWDKLYEIALGIAKGLEYLHKGCNTRIVHFDIKPHNILLDQDFCPKISDFGMAKLCGNKESAISMFGARGTIGYIAPEVVSRNFGTVSHKSDVYSYGMMVLEMVGGRKNVNDNVSHSSEIYFPHWAYQKLLLNEDLKLQGCRTEEEEEIAKKMILIGFWCIQTNPPDRPSMNKVIEMLVGSLEKVEMPPKPFLYSSSHSGDISTSISPIVPVYSFLSSSCTDTAL